MKTATIAAAIALALMTGPVLASPGNDGCVGNCSGGDGGSSNSNSNSNTNRSNSSSFAGASAGASATGIGIGVGGQGGSSRSTAFGGEGGSANATANPRAASINSLTIITPAKTMTHNFSESKSSSEFRGEYRYEYEGKLHNTPSMAVGTADATAPCYVGISGSAAVAGFGVGLGGSVYDKKCEEREIIRLGQSSGSQDIRSKADYLLGLQLDEVIERYEDEDEDEDETEDRVATGGTSTTNEGVFALTNY